MRLVLILSLLLTTIESVRNVPDKKTPPNSGLDGLREGMLKTLLKTQTQTQKAELKELMKQHKRVNFTHVNKQGDNIEEVNQKANKNNRNLFQSDIVLSPQQLEAIQRINLQQSSRGRRQAFKDNNYPRTLWDNRQVNYYYGASVPDSCKPVILAAIKFWEKNTCVTFVETRKAINTVRFFVGEGCHSNVGQLGGPQEISVSGGCGSVGMLAHEIGHTLGFWHTHARHDRDQFINVDLNNIDRSTADQFTKQTPQTNHNYGLGYDYASIMHYDGWTGSINGKETMVARNPQYQNTMGSLKVAFLDILMMNLHYQCKPQCRVLPDCKNRGFPHPRDCSRCICPEGFGGPLCSERPRGCGEVLIASHRWQSFTSELLGRSGPWIYTDYVECNFVIVAPVGKRIEVKLTGMLTPKCTKGCVYGGVGIKAVLNVQMSGARYCCAEDTNTVIVSPYNIVTILLYNGWRQNGFMMNYRYLEGGRSGGPFLNPIVQMRNPVPSSGMPPKYDTMTHEELSLSRRAHRPRR